MNWDERVNLYNVDLSDFTKAFHAMIEAMNAVRYPPLQILPSTITCKVCGERYEGSVLVDVDRICPDCTEKLERVAEKIGNIVSVTDLAGLADRSSRLTDHAIRYGRPWQEHVPAHSRHLLNEQP